MPYIIKTLNCAAFIKTSINPSLLRVDYFANIRSISIVTS